MRRNSSKGTRKTVVDSTQSEFFQQKRLKEQQQKVNLLSSNKPHLLGQQNEAIRKMMEKQYGYPAASFLICWVQDNTLKHIFNSKQSIKELSKYQRGGVMLFFQLPAELRPRLPPIE